MARLIFGTVICLLPALLSSCQQQINYKVPNLDTVSPSSMQAGQPAFTLTVNGSQFTPASTVVWNGTGRLTLFVSVSQLTAQILASDVQNAGTATVAVFTPQPGGGTSQQVTFTINTAPSLVPQITALSPSGASVGAGSLTVNVTGTNFVSLATVTVNGSARPTSFINSTLLQAAILSSDVSSAGTLQISVLNPSPGGGSSNFVSFSVKNLVPSIASLTPTAILAGSASSTISVTGSGFVPNSTVNINGAPRTTTFTSSTAVTASLNSGDLASAAVYQVQVANPTPGGGTSNALTFAVNPTELTGLPLLVDLAPDGTQANLGICGATCAGPPPTLTLATAGPSTSQTGEFVAFASNSTNLVATPTNSSSDIFLRDTCLSSSITVGGSSSCTPTTSIVTLSANGGAADGPSAEPSIDSAAAHAAYTSTASNLVNYVAVPGGKRQVYWGTVCTTACTAGTSSPPALVSISVDGLSVGNGESYNPVISPDGQYVAFVSLATNLVASPIADGVTPQVYIRDTCSFVPSAAPTGTCIPTTYLVSAASDGVHLGNAPSAHPAIANAGLYVSFVSSATNLVTAPGQTGANEIFDRSTCVTTIGTAGNTCAPVTTLISSPDGVTPADGASSEPAISADGRLIAFASTATTLINGIGPTQQVYAHDTCIGATVVCAVSNQLVSTPNGTTPANALSENPSINACGATTVTCITGQFIAFASFGTNFGAGVANGVENVFVRNACTIVPNTVLSTTTTPAPCVPYTLLASKGTGASSPPADGSSLIPSIGGDGQTVSFISFADNLVSRDTNALEDIFLAPASLTFNLTLTLPGAGSGTVTDGSGGQINCTDTLGVQSGTCTARYISGTTVTLTATPTANSGSVFKGWGGSVIGADCLATGTDPCVFGVGQNNTVTATFQ